MTASGGSSPSRSSSLVAASCGPPATPPSAGAVLDRPHPLALQPRHPPARIAVRRGRSGRSAWRSTGRRTRTTRASSSPRRTAGTRDAGVDLEILPYAHHDARGPDGGRPGRVRDQLPGRADVRGGGRRPGRLGDGDPPAHGAGDRGPRLVGHQAPDATSTARPTPASATRTRSPRCSAVIKADGGTGTFKTVTLDTAAYEALYAKRADFVITFTAWEGIEASRARDRAPDLRVRRLRLPGLLPGRPRLRPRLAGSAARPGPCVRGGDGSRLRARGRRPGRGRRPPGRPEPGRLRRQPEPAGREPDDSSLTGGFLRDAAGQVGRQTLAQWQGYSGFLFEQGLLAGPDGKPLTAAPDYGALFTNDFLP